MVKIKMLLQDHLMRSGRFAMLPGVRLKKTKDKRTNSAVTELCAPAEARDTELARTSPGGGEISTG